jgi:Carboxypeptidase regulatory-like domain
VRFRALVLISVWLLLALGLHAASLSGTVKDPSGAVVSGAAVWLEPLPRGTPLQTTTDAQGRFRFEEAAGGSYRLNVTKDGFEPSQRTVTVAGKPIDISVFLKLKIMTTTVQVSGRRSPLANSDPNYIALRSASSPRYIA